MARGGENGGVQRWIFVLVIGAILAGFTGLASWNLSQGSQIADRPCRAEISDTQKQLKKDLENRQDKSEQNILRAIDTVIDRIEKQDSKIDRLIERK